GHHRAATAADDRPAGGHDPVDRPLVVADHGRPQADRHPLRRHRLPLPADRRAGSDGHARPAGGARERPDQPEPLQRILHDARHDDDLPRDHAAQFRLLQLRGPPPDRRPRRRLPPPQRLQLLGLRRRRADPQPELARQRRAQPGLVRLRAPHRAALRSRRHLRHRAKRRLLGARSPGPRRLLGRRLAQLRDHDPQHARPRRDPDADADLLLVDADHLDPDRARLPGDHRRADPALDGPLRRHPLLHPLDLGRHQPHPDRRRPAALAAPVLGLRPPRGLHPDPAGLRHRLRDHPGLQPQAALRLRGDGLRDRGDRLPRVRRLGPPHVRDGPRPDPQRRLLRQHDADRDPHRREDLQLGRHDVGRPDQVHHPDAVRRRAGLPVHDRRYLGRDARLAADRHPPQRHLLRDRPLPLRALRRQHLRPARRHLLLVPEDHRQADGRAAGQDPLLGHVRRLQRHLLPDALPRPGRHAPPLRLLRRRLGLGLLEPDRLVRVVRARRQLPDLPLQRRQEPPARQAGRQRPVGRGDPGVVDPVAAAGLQLPRDPDRPPPRPALGREVRPRRRRGAPGRGVARHLDRRQDDLRRRGARRGPDRAGRAAARRRRHPRHPHAERVVLPAGRGARALPEHDGAHLQLPAAADRRPRPTDADPRRPGHLPGRDLRLVLRAREL
ncbi:MAG: Cytochrome c oxidase polypeptide I, partial [uncultured Thermomicrobiales bacterium]